MLRLATVLGVLLLVGCSTSGGSGDSDPEEQRCRSASDCRVPTPLCVDSICVACTDTAHCPAERPFCLEGACHGGACTDGGDCEAARPVCDRGLCVACGSNADCGADEVCTAAGSCGPCTKDAECDAGLICGPSGLCAEPPALTDVLFVLDRSGSMRICVPGASAVDGGRCDSNGDNTLDTDGASRLDVLRGALAEPTWLDDSQQLGLVVAGVGGEDPSCGAATVLVPPGSNRATFSAAFSNPALLEPQGGTPTAAALALAAEQTASSADMRVVLITDGLANCNFDHPMPCICANESGCITEDGSASVRFLEEGTFLDGRFCLDDTAGLEAVQQLRAAGVRTAIVTVGESAEGLAPMSSLAEAGGLRADDATGIHHAADSAALIRVLQTILAEE